MKTFNFILLLVAVFFVISFVCVEQDEKILKKIFRSWAKKHKKSYSSAEFPTRFAIFKENYLWIENHNSKNFSYKVGLNHFADLTNDEYRKFNLGLLKIEEKHLNYKNSTKLW